MKLLITTFTYAPNKDGVAEAVRSMAEGLSAKGHEVIVATSGVERRERELNGVLVKEFYIQNAGVWARYDVGEVERFKNFLKFSDPDILVNHCWDVWSSLLSQPLFEELKCKKIQVSHGYSQHLWTPHSKPFFGLGQWIKGLLWTIVKFPRILQSYDAVVYLSKKKGCTRFLDHTVSKLLRNPNTQIIPNSTEAVAPSISANYFRDKYNIGEGPLCLCVANYSQRKNQELAVRAFYHANIPTSTLLFIGSEFNKHSDKVRLVDRELTISTTRCRTVFLEKISREDTISAYVACNVVLLTAKAETQPIVLLEAMAAGKPWISTPSGCITLMEGGIIANGVKGISKAIKRVLENPSYSKSLADLGIKAATQIYNSEKVIDEWEKLMLKIISQRYIKSAVHKSL